MLSYMPRDKTVHEFVTVTHEGLRFRGQLFPTLNSMIKWFKEHFRDPIPQRMVTPSHATPSKLYDILSLIYSLLDESSSLTFGEISPVLYIVHSLDALVHCFTMVLRYDTGLDGSMRPPSFRPGATPAYNTSRTGSSYGVSALYNIS